MSEARAAGRTKRRQILGPSEAAALGLERYYSGRKCSRGHLAERYVKGRTCVECQTELNQRFYKSVTKPGRRIAKLSAGGRIVRGV